MAYGNDEKIEFEGIFFGTFGKSHKFQADLWEEPQFIPISQSEWEPDPSSDTHGKGRMFIAAWLVKKNGWQ